MAFSKLTGKGIDLSTDVITEFNSTGIDDNATSTAITIAANNSVAIPNIHGNTTTIGNLTVGGDFIVQGNNFTVDADSLRVEDSLIQLASNNESSDVIDIGFFGHYSNDGNTALHTGFFRDASDEQYYLFNGLEDANLDANNSVTTINRSGTGFTLADLNVGIISATKLSSRDGVLELDDDGTHNGIINVPATLLINIDSDNNNTGESFRIAKDRTGTSGGTELFRVQEDGKVGIGTSSPARLLTVSAAGATLLSLVSTDDDNCQLLFGDSADDTIGKILYRHADDRLTLQAGGTETLHIVGGNVGIGITDPSNATLEILSNSGANALLIRARTNDDYSFVQFYNNAGTTLRGQIANHNGDLNFYTGSSGAIRAKLNTSGHLAIGNTNATYILDVDAGAPASSDQVLGRFSSQNGIRDIGFVWDDSASTLGIATLTSHSLTFHTGGNSNERMRIDTSGNVGIGTSSPTSNCKLHLADSDVQIELEGTGGSNSGFINFDGTNLQFSTNRNMKDGAFSNTGKSNATMIMRGISGGSEFRFYTASADNTTATERMRIDGSGNVGIGVTSLAGDKLEVSGSIRQTGTSAYPLKVLSDSFVYYPHYNTAHIAYYKRSVHPANSNQYHYYWRTSDSGAPGGANETTHMTLFTGSSSGGRLYVSDGLTFSSSAAAAQTLDDYEEGTFTPSFVTSGTLTINSATYTKIGRQVTCRFHLTASTTCSGDITGLPFTPNGESAGVVGYQTHVSSETIGILVQAANVWNLRIGSTQYGLAAGKQIRGMFTYFTDA